jgi:hypothetical protein
MEVKLAIGMKQLLDLIRQLPPKQKARVRAVLEETKESTVANGRTHEDLLLNGPTFSEADIAKVHAAREAMIKWRSS